MVLILAVTLGAGPASAVSVAYYRFDKDGKTAGQTADAAADQTGDHDGSAVNGPTYSSSVAASTVTQTGAPNDLSLDFVRGTGMGTDGTEQYVLVQDSARLSFGDSSFTIEAWVKLASLGEACLASTTGVCADPAKGNSAYVVQKKGLSGNLPDRQMDFAFLAQLGNRARSDNSCNLISNKLAGSRWTGRELALEFGDGTPESAGGCGFTTVISTLEFSLADVGVWHFVSVTFDAATDTVRFVMDGQPADDVSCDAVTPATCVSGFAHIDAADGTPRDLLIGAKATEELSTATPQRRFDGALDELRISNVALSPGQLANQPALSFTACSMTNPTVIAAGDLSHERENITVPASCELRVEGQHDFNNVTVEDGGTLTMLDDDLLDGNPPMLFVTGDVTIEGGVIGGMLTATGEGFGFLDDADAEGEGEDAASQSGGGGGGYGGSGGDGSVGSGGAPYGLITAPDLPGSHGGNSGSHTGGSGGGAIRLNVDGTLTVEGALEANGGLVTNNGAGGSGGSIWITANALAGGGTISANGAAAQNSSVGGGGGGRIALYVCVPDSFGATTVTGGAGFENGEDGTVFVGECASGVPSMWSFFGIADGGSIDFTVAGVPLQVTTIPGQGAAHVAQAVADAINNDPALSALGIVATASGDTVTVNASIADIVINDPGLVGQGIPILSLELGPLGVLNTNAASDGATNDSRPQVATDGDGIWLAVWDAPIQQQILSARSMDDGATWSDPVAVFTGAGPQTSIAPEIATDGAGTWVVVWHSGDTLGGTIDFDNDILVARSTDDGTSWSPAAALNGNAATDTGRDEFPQISTDGLWTEGPATWVAVWSSTDDLGGTIGTDFDKLVARSTDGGLNWSGPVPLNTNAATDLLVTDSGTLGFSTDGITWVAVWSSRNDLGGPAGTDFDILVTRSTDKGVSWSDPAALNTNATTDGSADDLFPEVTADGVGNWVAVWTTSIQIRTASSADDGQTWSAPVVIDTNTSPLPLFPQVTSDGAENWIAVWPSTNTLGGAIGTDFDILRAESRDGGATWTLPSALNSNAATDSGEDINPQLTTDGFGRWVAVWQSDDDLGATMIGTDQDILVSIGSGPDQDGDGLTDGEEVNFYLTDPLDPDSDGDGFDDGVEVHLIGTFPNDEDSDDDSVCDGGIQVGVCTASGPDNCPSTPNSGQVNSDSLSAGDACQCGDLNNDGVVTEADVILVREHVVGATTAAILTRCNVIGPSDGGVTDCNVADAYVLDRFTDGLPVTLENSCQAYTGGP
ncbi:MAG: hypothetical protein IH974_06570 [Myxococcales bacterium]|nr:hypothetical protein [Myxococcales bacterium]